MTVHAPYGQVSDDTLKTPLTHYLLSRLEQNEGGCGIFVSVTKAIDVLLGEDLRTFCETVQKKLSDSSRNGDEVRVKHSLIAAKRLDGHAMGKINTLLADIRHGRVTVSMELEDHDVHYAATCK